MMNSGPPDFPEIRGRIVGRQIQRWLPHQASHSEQWSHLLERIHQLQVRDSLPGRQQEVFDLIREEKSKEDVIARLQRDRKMSLKAAERLLDATVRAIMRKYPDPNAS